MTRGDSIGAGRPLRDAAVLCAGGAATAVVLFSAFGLWRSGLALGAGLVLGALNGPWALRTLDQDISFRVASLGRLAALSVAGLGIGAVLGLDVCWLPVLGLGIAQLLLAAAAAREALRA